MAQRGGAAELDWLELIPGLDELLELLEVFELFELDGLLLEGELVVEEFPGCALALRMLPLEFGIVPGDVDDEFPGVVAALSGLVAEGLLPGEVGDCVEGLEEYAPGLDEYAPGVLVGEVADGLLPGVLEVPGLLPPGTLEVADGLEDELIDEEEVEGEVPDAPPPPPVPPAPPPPAAVCACAAVAPASASATAIAMELSLVMSVSLGRSGRR